MVKLECILYACIHSMQSGYVTFSNLHVIDIVQNDIHV